MKKAGPRPSDDVLHGMYTGDSMSIATIGKHFGKSPSTARKWLLQAGVELRSPSSKTRYGEAKKLWPGDEVLQEMYIGKGMTLRAMKDKLGVGYGTVREWVIKAGIPLRHDNSRRYPVEPLLEFLSTPSHDLWYFIGYFYADGNMSDPEHRYTISISSTDKENLEKILEVTGYTGRISTRSRGDYHPIHVMYASGKSVHDAMAGFGLTPNKSKTMRMPEVPGEYLGDFVRGHFDGDGSIFLHTQPACFTAKIASASPLFICDLRDAIVGQGVIPAHIYRQESSMGDIDVLRVNAHDALVVLARLMYGHSPSLYMERKWRLFAMVLSYTGMVRPGILTR